MHLGTTFETVQKIHLYDGYRERPIWKDDGESVYYNYEIDKQCRIPIDNIGQIREKLKMGILDDMKE